MSPYILQTNDKKPAYTRFHSKRPHIIIKMKYINMDSTIVRSINVH